MKRKKHFIHAIFLGLISVGVLAASAVGITPVSADDSGISGKYSSTLDSDVSNLTIEYFDDEDQTIPVSGAEFRVYQIAEIGREGSDNGAWLPLIEDIDFSDVTDAESYESLVERAYSDKPDLGYTADVEIGDSGRAKLTGIPAGAYLVVETKTPRYHIRSIPFIVSTPEMNADSTGWNTDVKCSPKSTTAGDLKITKVVIGKGADKDAVFHMTLSLPEGSYKARLADGTESVVTDGSSVSLKGGQSVTIYDVVSGSDYAVAEAEANRNGYRTVYKNASGKIKEKTETDVTVTNRHYPSSVSTFVASHTVQFAELIGFTLTALVLLIVAKHRQSSDDKS